MHAHAHMCEKGRSMNTPTNGSFPNNEWQEVGPLDDFKTAEVQEVEFGTRKIAVSFKENEFGVVSGVCNHVGGPWEQMARGGRTAHALDVEGVVSPK